MPKSMHSAWRIRLALGLAAAVAALSPLMALAQQSQPDTSGAVVSVGGVTAPAAPSAGGATQPAVSAGGATQPAVSAGGATQPAAPAPAVAGAQSRPIVLPNTGAGPVREVDGLLVALAGLAVSSAGLALRRRASRLRVEG